jgi:regulatory protein
VPILTRLAPDPLRPDYRLVDVDRGRFASLPAESLAPLGLAVGAALTPDQLDRLRALADIEAASRAAYRAVARRAHAVEDLRRRLLQRQHPPFAVDAALARLVADGLLDDARFAREVSVSRARRGRGPARIVHDLLSQGVARGVAEAAVRDALAAEDWDSGVALREVAEKRAEQLRALPVQDRRRRLLAFLRRRGFSGAETRAVVAELCRSA